MSRKKKNLERQAPETSSGTRRIYGLLVAVAVLGVAILGYSLVTGVFNRAATGPVEVDVGDDPARLIELAQGVERGDPDAPVTILEFADYQCPACAHFAQRIKPRLQAEYVETGQVRYVFHDFPVLRHGFLAGRAARCAGDQGVYWEYHDALIRNQNEWSRRDDPRRLLTGYAEDLGADRSEFRSCLNSDRHAETVTANRMLGERLGVGGTPTVLVSDGSGSATRVSDWDDYGAVSGAIEAALRDEESGAEN